MNRVGKVKVYLHSDRVEPNCHCGVREWEVMLPKGWKWRSAPTWPPLFTLDAAMKFAQSLSPESVAVVPSGYPDTWVLSQKLSEATKVGSTSRTPTAVDTPSYN